jgi:uncharacterized protein YcbX
LSCLLRQIFIYPVKSCAGIELRSSEISSAGLAYDRQWMIINSHGQMLTQRKLSSMALIKTHIDASGQLHLDHPSAGSVQVQESDQIQAVSVWKDTVPAQQASSEISDWLKQALQFKEPLSLVRFIPGSHREPSQETRFGQKSLSFSDAAPLLICNQASLDTLNQVLANDNIGEVDMRHFRPNLVIEGLPAFAEHNVSMLRRGDLIIKLIDHCQRCVMITINPETGEKRKNSTPFAHLSAINAMPNNDKAPAFGVNACPDSQAQSLEIGMKFEID